MNPFLPTLLLATALLAVAAAALSGFGLTQRIYRGFRWWMGALWLNTAALALLSGVGLSGTGALFVQLLFVPWPILTLIGVRRFHSRTTLPGSERLDLGTLGMLLTLGTIGCLFLTDGRQAQWLGLAVAALAQLHVAAVLWRAPVGYESKALRSLALLWTVTAVLPLIARLWLTDFESVAAFQTSIVCIGSVLVGFFALILSSQRTARDLHRSHRRLRVLANIDMLTQVPNRRRFEELAQRALRADAPGSAVLLLLDIDHFKQINDKLGHAAGDRALRLVSRCTLDLLRSHDVAGRHGGDEFVLLLRRSSTDQAMVVAERLVSHLQLQSHAHALPRLSLSFGIVQMRPGESIDDTLQRADLALYEAKRLGRSRAVAADGGEEQPTFRSSERLGLTSS
jgi:diguanylate cyclase (GGDEF)-like protein